MSQNLRTLKSKRYKLLDLQHLGKSCAIYFLIFSVCFLNLCAADDQPQDKFDATQSTVNPFAYAKSLSDSVVDKRSENSINDKTAEHTTSQDTAASNLGFTHAFIASISVILVSELGDKTFFIAAIMAMRHARLLVFTGAIGALGLMTVLSAVFGMAATVIPRIYTFYVSAALFAIFGFKMLYEGYHMSPTDAQEELEEVQSDLKRREIKQRNRDKTDDLHCDKPSINPTTGALLPKPNNDRIVHRNRKTHNDSDEEQNAQDAERVTLTSSSSNAVDQSTSHLTKETSVHLGSNGDVNHSVVSEASSSIPMKRLNRENATENTDVESISGSVQSLRQSKNVLFNSAARVFMQAFTMTFLAEWGDRSQLTTIILSASENVYGVIVGGVLGHSFCTGLAVIGGRMIAQKISVRAVTIVGGIVFLLFAVSALVIGPEKD